MQQRNGKKISNVKQQQQQQQQQKKKTEFQLAPNIQK